MTTIVANRNCMAADNRVTGMPMFSTEKLFRINGSILGIAGSTQQCLRFIEWRRTPEAKPTFTETADFEVLELTSDGRLLWWGPEMVAIPIADDYYAIGSGAAFALGAMDMGASPERAIKSSAKWDSSTGSTIQVKRLKAHK
jgi:ATP-dependent protease HslVU (ClpYQ) peptidase subunit